VLKHESHLVAPAVDSCNTKPEGDGQIVEPLVQHIRRDGALRMTPQALDQVQARAIGRQPLNLELFAVLLQPLTHSFGVMQPAVVTNQADLSTRKSSQERYQECEEVGSRLGWSDRVCDPAYSVIDATIDHGLLVLSRGRDLRLRADWRVDPTKG
jgi:hypothetical protein